MFLIICYAIHEQSVVSIDRRDNYDSAVAFLKEDAEKTFNEERQAGSQNASLDYDGEDKAVLTSGECIWTWEIRELA